MDCQNANPIVRYARCFDSNIEAANAVGISTEALRKMRLRGYVSTRDRALQMARACNGKVAVTDLLGLQGERAA